MSWMIDTAAVMEPCSCATHRYTNGRAITGIEYDLVPHGEPGTMDDLYAMVQHVERTYHQRPRSIWVDADQWEQIVALPDMRSYTVIYTQARPDEPPCAIFGVPVQFRA
jgi:hypothetical protein